MQAVLLDREAATLLVAYSDPKQQSGAAHMARCVEHCMCLMTGLPVSSMSTPQSSSMSADDSKKANMLNLEQAADLLRRCAAEVTTQEPLHHHASPQTAECWICCLPVSCARVSLASGTSQRIRASKHNAHESLSHLV